MPHWTERQPILLAVYIILRRDDGRIFTIRRAHTGYMDGHLTLPSGHVDAGEPADVAAAREAKEEAGVDVAVQDLRLVFSTHRKTPEKTFAYVDFYFEAMKWSGEPFNAEPEKSSEGVWIDPEHFPEDMIPDVRLAIERSAAGQRYASVDF